MEVDIHGRTTWPGNTTGAGIVKTDLPKSCARCKSKQWRYGRARIRSAPYGLTMWAKDVFATGRKEGISDEEIALDWSAGSLKSSLVQNYISVPTTTATNLRK